MKFCLHLLIIQLFTNCIGNVANVSNVTENKDPKAAAEDSGEMNDLITVNYPSSCPPWDGIYPIKMHNQPVISVLCDTILDGPGWMVIMRRYTGDLNFYRSWEEYKSGFGNMTEEFFIGLENLAAITSNEPHRLYIQLETFSERILWAEYTDFTIGTEEQSFALLSLGRYIGNAEDSLRAHINAPFSTYDNDNCNGCVMDFMGAWWYIKNNYCNLFGMYVDGYAPWGQKGNIRRGAIWNADNYSFRVIVMMIRPSKIKHQRL